MRVRSQALAAELEAKLLEFRVDSKPLPGIAEADNRSAYVEQLVESIRRIPAEHGPDASVERCCNRER